MNIRDIAARCGVSTATVSRVLNGSPRVRDETRARVLAVVEEAGYTPNAFARGLGLGTMRMVGVLCADVTDTYYARAVSLIQRGLRAAGFDALLTCTGSRLEDKKKSIRLLLNKGVDALVLIGSVYREERDNSHIGAAAARVPVVVMNGLVELPGVYNVLCDEKAAMAANVRALHAAGCRRILYLFDTLTWSGSQKLAGCREGLAACGLPEAPELIFQTEGGVAGAMAATAALLAQGTAFDAVLASEDVLAVGAQKALAAKGLAPPIIGFDNTLPAECASPAITSVDNMLPTLCGSAVGGLVDILSGGSAPPKVVVSARLVERETFRAGG